MILAEDLAIMDWNSQKKWERDEGIKEGIKEGEKNLNELYVWLFSQGRAEDVQKATRDSDYLNQLFEEYSNR